MPQLIALASWGGLSRLLAARRTRDAQLSHPAPSRGEEAQPLGPAEVADSAALHTTQVIEAMAPSTEFFVDLMMLEELQMVRARLVHGLCTVHAQWMHSGCTVDAQWSFSDDPGAVLPQAPPPELSALQAAAKVGSSVLVCGGMLPLCYALLCLSRPGPAAFALALGVAVAGLARVFHMVAAWTHPHTVTACACGGRRACPHGEGAVLVVPQLTEPADNRPPKTRGVEPGLLHAL